MLVNDIILFYFYVCVYEEIWIGWEFEILRIVVVCIIFRNEINIDIFLKDELVNKFRFRYWINFLLYMILIVKIYLFVECME